jgi:beta-galactosidase
MNVRLLCLFVFCVFYNLNVRTENNVHIGAQVYIEPGQTEDEIAHYFKVLKAHNMSVCRIRMDESHLRQAGGSYDFSLYDLAFKEAEKNDIQIFATLFPANILSDANSAGGVGGFKFPTSEEHLKSISRYIAAVVKHFKFHPALKAWVLQNEPGVAGNMPRTEFAKK